MQRLQQYLFHAVSSAYAAKEFPPFNPMIINKDLSAAIWEHI